MSSPDCSSVTLPAPLARTGALSRAPGRPCASIDSLAMSTPPARTQPVIAAPAAAPAQPPQARRVRSDRTHHGDVFVDEYGWLADKEDPDTIAYLEAQNAYS